MIVNILIFLYNLSVGSKQITFEILQILETEVPQIRARRGISQEEPSLNNKRPTEDLHCVLMK